MKGGRGRKRKGERATQKTEAAKKCKILCESSISTDDSEEIFEEESEDSEIFQKQRSQNSTMKGQPWTEVEEKILEEGVKSCWTPENGKLIPWMQILKFCKDKLQPCRTNNSLRDKWRNMHGSRASKSEYVLSSDKMKIENKNTKKKEEKIGTLGGRPINEIEFEHPSEMGSGLTLSSTMKGQPWTETEEKILEEGVKSCWTPQNDKLIPWTQILKFCKAKLQPCRTNNSIRDKWRNLHGSRRAKLKSQYILSSDKMKIENKNTKKKEKKEKKIGTLGGRPIINEIGSDPISNGQMFDPMKKLSGDLVEAFKSWHGLPRSKKRKVEIRLPIAYTEVATAQWFDRMWIRRKWLSNEHVDSLLSLLIMKANNEPGMFLPRWTCVETICWHKMGLVDFKLGSRLMMQYVEGKLPRQGGKAWCEVDNIYGIAHLNDSHWVAYQINIKDQRITVYDSLSRGSRWDEVKPAFENLSRYVPWLCKKGRVMEEREFSGRSKRKWELVRYEHPPQQENISDCGIMAIKFIECLVSGRPLDYIDPLLGGDFRSYFCTELFNGGQKA